MRTQRLRPSAASSYAPWVLGLLSQSLLTPLWVLQRMVTFFGSLNIFTAIHEMANLHQLCHSTCAARWDSPGCCIYSFINRYGNERMGLSDNEMHLRLSLVAYGFHVIDLKTLYSTTFLLWLTATMGCFKEKEMNCGKTKHFHMIAFAKHCLLVSLLWFILITFTFAKRHLKKFLELNTDCLITINEENDFIQ